MQIIHYTLECEVNQLQQVVQAEYEQQSKYKKQQLYQCTNLVTNATRQTLHTAFSL